ncbi:hypothetical protein [Methylobacterium pseudosasicola]|uniref:Uncharacterized protein n=1 Tax=Methylobacterium pseudosasicola TaxID=582667 RepID=A0A1I4VJ08_9HYPH|nr:hypothetical protein [Methylobacterium pseudosasicola]SFN01248.1 hypothetical protein SAMN05192568_11044 [Methylobacterium pseudosasicola]
MSVLLTCKAQPEVVEQIDRAVIAYRIANPETTFTRAQFVREAVQDTLARLAAAHSNTGLRERVREAPVKPVALAAGVRG